MITLLFLDFAGFTHGIFAWTAKLQFLPAILALNAIVIIGLLILTLVFGRLYCSVICPLGVFQDIVSHIAGKFKKRRFRYSPTLSWLRYIIFGVLVLAIVLHVAGFGFIAAWLDPYAAYGRIVSNLFSPVYNWFNNIFAGIAEKSDSYMFYRVDILIKSGITFAVAAVTFVIVAFFAWKHGRTYCNTFCPVGTLLGFFSRFSLFRPMIDESKCVHCSLCERNCKAACINSKLMAIDHSRCVTCFNCIDNCHRGAIKYRLRSKKTPTTPTPVADTPKTNASASETPNTNLRNFIATTGVFLAGAAINAQTKNVDGGLAVIKDKQAPERNLIPAPPGSKSIKSLNSHCTGCQLCIQVCPNSVLSPSEKIGTLMHPEMSFEKGFCRPECTKCSEVCPTGAINKISVAEKSSTQIGHAVTNRHVCLAASKQEHCHKCASICPTGAIKMVPLDPNETGKGAARIPVVDSEKCIGCGKCEYLCPARPTPGIYVEGHEVHRTI